MPRERNVIMKFVEEFKKFAFKGNVVDMAVGVVIGGAFGKIVTSLVGDIIMPLIGKLTGGINFSELKLVLSEATDTAAENAVMYGSFIQNIVDFFIIALSVFLFVKLIATWRSKHEERKRKEEAQAAPAAPAKPTQEELLTEIRDLLKENKKI